MNFKSLTMRIWFTISVIVSTIVVIVSLAFAFLLQGNSQDKAEDMLQMTHQFVLTAIKNGQPAESVGDLKGGHHFLLDEASGAGGLEWE